jgi:hypothetical protein
MSRHPELGEAAALGDCRGSRWRGAGRGSVADRASALAILRSAEEPDGANPILPTAPIHPSPPGAYAPTSAARQLARPLADSPRRLRRRRQPRTDAHTMNDGKITISWDELKTRQVEQRIGAMNAVKRNREYAQLTDAPEPAAPAPIKNFFYNTVVYMTVFGFVGGFLAWGCWTLLHFKGSVRNEAFVQMERVGDPRERQAHARGEVDHRRAARARRAEQSVLHHLLRRDLTNEQRRDDRRESRRATAARISSATCWPTA